MCHSISFPPLHSCYNTAVWIIRPLKWLPVWANLAKMLANFANIIWQMLAQVAKADISNAS